MAGSRTVTLNVVGNVSGATKALDDVAGKSESTAKRASAAFGGVLSTLNSTGVLGPFGESLDKIGGLFDTIGEKGKGLGKVMLGVGAAGVGIGGILTAAAGPDQAAAQQLQQAIENVGGSYDDYKDKIESTIKANEKFGTTAGSTQDAIRILTQGTGDAGKAIGMMGEASNLAAARHESLSQAATDLVKIYSGKGTRILSEFGLSTSSAAKDTKALETATKNATAADDTLTKAKQKLTDLQAVQSTKTKLTVADQIALRNAQEAVTDDTAKATDAHKKLQDAQDAAAKSAGGQGDVVAALGQKLQGQAAAEADTFTGHLKAMKAEFEDQAAKIGQKYGPALTGMSAGITVLGGAFEGASAIISKFKGTQEAATTATEGLTAAEEAETITEGLALGPILLIIGALAAVGAAIYLLWTNWSTVWGWIKGVAMDVWKWIKDNWPLLLGILTGPIGLAVGEIIKHWGTIKSGFTDVKNWIGDRVDDIVSFFTGMPKRISDAVAHAFDSLVSAFEGAIKGMLKAVPGSGIVTSVLGGIADHLPHFAGGGSIAAGQLSVVGENGPELFMPGTAGTIIPNGSGGVGNVTVTQHIYASPGMNINDLATAVQRKLLQTSRARVSIGLR